MEIKIQKDILDIIKDIKDIDEQLNSSELNREKIQKITLKAKTKFSSETMTYELSCSAISGKSIEPIGDISSECLLNRFPLYRSLYLNELRKKCKDEEEYYEVLKEHQINVKY